AFRIKYLGRKSGRITELFKQMRDIAPEDRPAFGQHVNALKERTEARLAEAEARWAATKRTRTEALDLTLPGRPAAPAGSLHPITRTLEDIKRTFERFGFSVAEGPEIEDDWHNFGALNFPADHPAR